MQTSGLKYLIRETFSLVVVLGCFYLIAAFLFPKSFFLINDRIVLSEYSLQEALKVNFISFHAIVTVIGLGVIFWTFRSFAQERADSFAIIAATPNLAGAIRDFAGVCILCFFTTSLLTFAFTKSYLVSSGMLLGAIFSWSTIAVIFNLGGSMEKPKQTLTQMGIIAAIILIGQIFRAVSNTNAPFSVIHFLSSIASVYIVAMAAAILAYPNLGLLVKFQGGRLKVFFKSFGVVCMLYLLAIPMTIVPVLLGVMLMVILMPIGMIAGAVDADVGKYFETISLAIVSPGKSLFFLLIYSPIIYIGAFFKQIIIGTIHLEFESIGELASYLFAMLLVLRNYRKIFTENEPD